jgi:hypothetical protein
MESAPKMKKCSGYLFANIRSELSSSVAEPHHFYAAPGKNFDATPAPTLLYAKPTF